MARFRPSLRPTLFVIPTLALLIALGTWQLERRAWKAELIARIEHGLDQPPAALPARIDDPAAWDYRRAIVEGRFDHAHELHLLGRTYQGMVGEHIVTPLLRSDGAGTILVDRGWVPLDRADPPTRTGTSSEGPVTVEGVLRVPAEPGWMRPDNDPAANAWFWVDLPAMAAAVGAASVAPLILEAGPNADPSQVPVGGQTRVDIPNDHLQYALTWYGFAVVLVIVYLTYHLRRPKP